VPNKAQDDELVMSLVELALARAPEEREAYLRSACDDPDLLAEARKYVEWEERMDGFLLAPLYPSPLSELTLEPGELLDGRFRIIREVAQGGMGIVYEARDEKLDRPIAIKCAKASFRKRLPPEVRHASEISHPNICKIFEIHTAATDHGEIDFLTMEFLEGETLTERLRRGRLPEEKARTIGQQICAGLAAAHRNQVIHGDLKSSNVILTKAPDGSTRAVITDFGLARHPETTQQTVRSGDMAGTPDYMAPELWKGERATVATDIYALGVILYELATGHGPFASSELTWEQRLSPRPPAVNPKWDRVLGRCLEADPARRFRTAEEVELALAPRSQRWLWTAAAAVLLAAVSGVITYQRATAPPETQRLALLPFEATSDVKPVADNLLGQAATELAKIQSSAHTKFVFLPWDKVVKRKLTTAADARTDLGATLALHGAIAQESGKLNLHVSLTDTNSGTERGAWDAVYAPGELRYLPTALAGIVTESLHLPPPNGGATVNAAARDDYQKGLASVRMIETGVDNALAQFERAVAADPDSALTYAGLADAQWLRYRSTRDPVWLERTNESLRQARLRNPDLGPVHCDAGRILYNGGRYDQAAAEYLRATEVEPNNSDGYRLLGVVYDDNNQLDEAVAMLQKAVKIEPKYYANYQQLGAFYFHRTNYTEAAREFQRAIDLAPDEPNAHRALGDAYINLGRFGEAEHEFRLALSRKETYRTLEDLGLSLLYQRREREAIPYLLRAAQFSPTEYLPWYHLGVAYRWLVQKAKSEEADRHGMELAEVYLTHNPRDGEARSYLAYFCARLGENRRAELEAAQALQLSANYGDTRTYVALTQEVLGNRDAALAVLKDAPTQVLADLERWPDAANLHNDPQFLKLLDSRQVKYRGREKE
jgi:eukaryotic-like serine/threonine-protein kinase